MTVDLDFRHAGLCYPYLGQALMVKYGSRSHNENVPVSAMDWKHVTSDAGLFLDVCRVVCTKAVGATSSEGFLFVSF